MTGTNYFTEKTSTVDVALTDGSGNATLVRASAVPSGDSGYAVGCILQNTSTGHLYQNEGTTSSCSFTDISEIETAEIADGAVTSPKLASNTIQVKEVDLTAANLIAMYATPVEIVPAITSKAIIVDSVELVITGTATQFTGGGVIGVQYADTANGAGTLVHADIAASVLTGATAKIYTNRIPVELSSVATAAINGIGLYISNKTAAFADGTGTAKVIVRYHTLD